MWSKVFSYEWKRTWKLFAAYIFVLYALAILSRWGNLSTQEGGFGIVILNDVLLTFLTFLPSFIYLGMRYYRSFHSPEALFTFSLPMPTRKILLGKLFFMVSFIFLNAIVSYLAYILLGSRIAQALTNQSGIARLLLILSLSLSVWNLVLPLFAIISLVHLEMFRKRILFFGILFFFGFQGVREFMRMFVEQQAWLQFSIRFTLDGGYRLTSMTSPLLETDSGLNIAVAQIPQSLIYSIIALLFIIYYFNKRLVVEAS